MRPAGQHCPYQQTLHKLGNSNVAATVRMSKFGEGSAISNLLMTWSRSDNLGTCTTVPRAHLAQARLRDRVASELSLKSTKVTMPQIHVVCPSICSKHAGIRHGYVVSYLLTDGVDHITRKAFGMYSERSFTTSGTVRHFLHRNPTLKPGSICIYRSLTSAVTSRSCKALSSRVPLQNTSASIQPCATSSRLASEYVSHVQFISDAQLV
jgi:hypothetical protein